MKKIIYSAFALIGLFIVSCAPDKADDPNSPQPTTDDRDKFVAIWSVTEQSKISATPNSYTVNITKSSSNSSAITIENFYGLTSYSVSATISGNILSIPYQQVKDNVSSSLGFASGSGTLTSSTHINLTYTTAIGANNDTCTAVYLK